MAMKWYVIHAYSGYENRVKLTLEERIRRYGLEDMFEEVVVPTEQVVEMVKGKRRTSQRKFFPGYVLVQMIVTDDSWYVVRNTPNVTGFIGSGTIPTPISEEEIKTLQKRMGVSEPKYKIDVVVGEAIKIIDGPFKDFDGKVSNIDPEKGKIKVLVSVFGRETPVELDFLQIKKI